MGDDETAGVRRFAQQLAPHLQPRPVLVCIGNDLRGDDAAGPMLAERLAGRLPWPLFDTHSAPENFLAPIAAAGPDPAVLVDAVDLGRTPGTVAVLGDDERIGQSLATHGPSPAAFIASLKATCPCRVIVIGIQPARLETGAEPTQPVRDAVEALAEALLELAAGRIE